MTLADSPGGGGFQNKVATLLPGQVDTADIADGAVTSIKIASNLQSDNYNGGVIIIDPGTIGWRIERNSGDAVFNNLVVRNGVFISGELSVNNDGNDRSLLLSPTAAGATQLGIAWKTEVDGGGNISASIYTSDGNEPDLIIEASSDLELWGANHTRMGFNGTWPMQTTTNVGDGSADQALLLSGTVSRPGLAFSNDIDTGPYREGSNILAFATGGAKRGAFRSYGFESANKVIVRGLVLAHDPDTTTATPNATYVGTSVGEGVTRRLVRKTSARKYKSRINYNVEYLVNAELKPVKFYAKNDKRWFFGFVAEDLANEHKLFAEYDANGEVENFNLDSVIAILAAKVNRLERLERAA